MTTNLTTRIASVALALLMTLAMLGGIDGFAQAESAAGTASVMVTQASQPAARV